MESLSFATLDVFTSTPYSGNPLSIIILPSTHRHLAPQWRKQLIAREFNLSESVFIHEQEDTNVAEWRIDIFTTTAELPFAGHPTIGAACFVLGLQQAKGIGNGKGVFVTKAGRIPVSILPSGEESGIRVQAEIPHCVHIHAHTIGDLEDPVSGLSSHPKLRKAEINAPIVSVVLGMTFLLIRLESLELLGLVKATSSELNFHGLLDQEWREGFVAKYYYVVLKDRPRDGIGKGKAVGEEGNGAEDGLTRIRARMLEEYMEDPATGSAACALGSYLALKNHNTQRFEVVQGVEMGRRSVIGVEVVVDESGETVQEVRLSGSAVQVMEGNLRM
jgi:PhzF family phenazine biosynthesis protein